MSERDYRWTDWVTALAIRRSQPQYRATDTQYWVWFWDGAERHICSIWLGEVPHAVQAAGYSQVQNDADKADFESLFLPTINKANVVRSTDGTLQASKQQLELGRQSFKRTDNQSEQMNINGIAAGVPVNVWNGTGVTDFGSDWTRSGVGSETAQSAHSGTNGLDSGVTTQNDSLVFDSGSMQNIAGIVDQVEFWIQLKALVSGGQVRIGWMDDTNTLVGTTVRLRNYLSNFDLNEWKKVTIPIEDFGLTGNARKLFIRFINVNGLHIWVDDIAVVPSAGGGPHIFRISAPTGLIYHVERIALVVSASDIGWSSTAFANIIGGLTNGLVFRYRMLGGETYWAFNCKNNSELFGQLTVLNDIQFDNAEQMVVFALEPQLSSVVLVDDDEVVEVIVRDDLSSLTDMRAFLHYGVEEIPT